MEFRRTGRTKPQLVTITRLSLASITPKLMVLRDLVASLVYNKAARIR